MRARLVVIALTIGTCAAVIAVAHPHAVVRHPARSHGVAVFHVARQAQPQDTGHAAHQTARKAAHHRVRLFALRRLMRPHSAFWRRLFWHRRFRRPWWRRGGRRQRGGWLGSLFSSG